MRAREQLLSVSPHTRPGSPLGVVKAAVVHYLGEGARGWTEQQARDYFESLRDGAEPVAKSCHRVIGPREVLTIVPPSEIAYHCGTGMPYPAGYTDWAVAYFGAYPNAHALGYECCFVDDDGRLAAETIANLTAQAAVDCARFGLDPETQLLRHHDVTGKSCPLWYVRHPREWRALQQSVAALVREIRSRGPLWQPQ